MQKCRTSHFMWKKFFIGVLVILVAIQFVRQPKNLSSNTPGPDDLIVRTAPDPAVGLLLQNTCYDCHSNHTRYPWYAEVQPIGWWLANHINEGKDHINFSTFGQLPPKRAAHKLEACADEIDNGDMPLSSYMFVHHDARLTPIQRKLLSNWFGLERAKYPAASE